jgi:hypothetical protein
MLTEALIILGGAAGAIAGAAASNTEWGQEIEDKLEEAFGFLEDGDTDLLSDDN